VLRLSSLYPSATHSWNWQITYGTRAYWIGLGLLVVVMFFALLKAYREWQDIHDVEEPDSPDDLLRSFREAHALGELDDEEMQRVERRLSASSGPLQKPSERARSAAQSQPRPAARQLGGEGPNVGPAEDNPGGAPAQSDQDRQ